MGSDGVRTAWQAIGMRPSAFLTSSWPWRSVAYLGSGVLIGAATAASLVLLAVGGVLLAVALVGLVLLAACLLSGVAVGRLERWRLRLVDGYGVADPHRRPDRPGIWPWLTTRIREPVTWRELAYTVVSVAVLWAIDGGVLTLCLGLPVSLLTTVAVGEDATLASRLTSLATGLALLPVAAYPITAWAAARAELTKTVLGPRDTELGDRLAEVSRSRARLVDAFDSERVRIERDLHDGAQQRLVAVNLKLGMALLDLGEDSPAHRHVTAAREHAVSALAELRTLIRGVHPQVLTDRGLAAAVADLASHCPVPVSVDLDVPERLPSPVESAAYFAVSEALANVAKHAGAGSVRVTGRVAEGRLAVEIRDDGRGGARPAAGTGLTGLADRVAVLDGRLYLSSPPGGPTLVRVELPCPA